MEKDQMNKIVATTSPWHLESQIDQLDENIWQFIKSHGILKQYKRDELILAPGTIVDQLLVICQGQARMVLMDSEGEEKLVCYIDSFVAADGLFTAQPTHYSIVADTDCVALYVIADSDVQILLDNNKFLKYLLKIVSHRARVLGWQVIDATFSNALEKVCRVLCCYAMRDGNKFTAPLTHIEISQMTGLHRVTVTNQIMALRQQGIVKLDAKGHISIADWEALKELGLGDSLDGLLE